MPMLRLIDVLLVLALLGAGYAAPIPTAPSFEVLSKTQYVRLPQEDPSDDLIRLKKLFQTENAKATASTVLHQAQLEAQTKVPTLWDKIRR